MQPHCFFNRSRVARLRPMAFSVFVLTSTCVLQAQVAPTSAAATSTQNKSGEQVVVLDPFTVEAGFRGSLAAAAQVKENMVPITEIIAAEDIGKLPDTSIADSLTRLTGLTTQRTNGRSQGISIRGLTGDFSTGMLNGREQVSTNLNRAVEFDQYPAELLNEVVVYKTASADLVGQGLAGTIDLRTVKPLDKGRRTIAASGYYEWTELGALNAGSERDGKRFNFSYIDQLAEGKVGVALGFAHTDKPFQGEQWQAWGYPTDASGTFVLGGAKPYVRSSNLEREGYMAVVEYKPNKNIHSTVDFYRSFFEETQLLRGIEIPLFWSSAQLQPGYTVQNGLATESVFRNVFGVARNDIVVREDDLVAFGWNLKLGDGTGWTAELDLGYSRVKRNDSNLETWSGTGFNRTGTPDVMTVRLGTGRGAIFTPTIDYANPSALRLTDPQGWGVGTLPTTGMSGYLKYFRSKDELGQVKVLARRSLGAFFRDMEVGASYSDRYKRDGENPTGFLFPATGQSSAPLPASVGVTNLGFLGIRGLASYDPLAAFNSGTYGFLPNPYADVIANRWQVREKITRAYLLLNIDHKIRELPVTGNIGFQGTHNDQESTGISTTGAGAGLRGVSVTDGDKYYEFAPSMNLIVKPMERTYVRLSLARQIARPRMFDMKASRTFGYDVTRATSTDPNLSPWSGDGGNPKLRPWRANSVDLSLERYFRNNMGYVALTGFHKELLSFIYQQTTLGDFTGFPTTDGSTPQLTTGKVTRPANGDGGSIKGVELTVSLPSELLFSNVRGFGVVLGGAYTDSSIRPWGPTAASAPISGLSRKVANVTLYYERAGFSARVSERYRSEYRAYITNFGPPNFKGDVSPNGDFRTTQPERVVDAQVSYSFHSGRMKGLTLYVQAYNLNDEPLVTYENNDPRRVRDYQRYGASYSAGFGYKF